MNKLTRSLARVVVRSGSASQPVSVAVARGLYTQALAALLLFAFQFASLVGSTYISLVCSCPEPTRLENILASLNCCWCILLHRPNAVLEVLLLVPSITRTSHCFLHVKYDAGFAGKVPAEQGYIPDVDGLVGRARQEAVVRKAFGEELYDRDAPAFFEEGTRENPIPILSVENERIVGVSLPVRTALRECRDIFVRAASGFPSCHLHSFLTCSSHCRMRRRSGGSLSARASSLMTQTQTTSSR